MRGKQNRFGFMGGLLVLAAMVTGSCEDVSSGTVTGTVTLAPGVAGTLGASDTLFITARPVGAQGGPPLAVLRIQGMRFPMTYTIGQEDVVQPGTWFRGKVEVRALLRKSGIVSVALPGDLAGASPKNPVEVGTEAVDLTLDLPKS